MKFMTLKQETLLEDIEEIGKYIIQYEGTILNSNFILNPSKSDFTPRLRLPSYSIDLNYLKSYKDSNLEKNLKKLALYLQTFTNQETGNGGKYYYYGVENLFYSQKTNFLSEYFYNPIVKDFNERNVTIELGGKKFIVKTKLSDNSINFSLKKRMIFSISDKDENIEISSEENASYLETIKNLVNKNLKEIILDKLTNLILLINVVSQGELPILSKEFGLEKNNENIFKLKYNLFVNRVEIDVINPFQSKELNDYIDFYTNGDKNILNEQLPKATGILALKKLFSNISNGFFFKNMNSILKQKISENNPELFKIEDENPIFLLEGDFEFYGKINQETFFKISDYLKHLNSWSTNKKFLNSLKKLN